MSVGKRKVHDQSVSRMWMEMWCAYGDREDSWPVSKQGYEEVGKALCSKYPQGSSLPGGFCLKRLPLFEGLGSDFISTRRSFLFLKKN